MKKVLYYLSYDLVKEKDYEKLYEELELIGAKRVLESVWCFRYAKGKSSDLIDRFKKFIDSDDRLLIVESAGSAWINLLSDPNKV